MLTNICDSYTQGNGAGNPKALLYSNSSISQIKQTVELLLSLGLSPLPVAPYQDAEKYPLRDKDGEIIRDKDGNPKPQFTGKNPSYLDRHGSPRKIAHGKYQKRQPTAGEIAEWWANPANGLGSLGGNGYVWLDIDRKNFDSQEECDRQFNELLSACPPLAQTWLEQTHSGGYRALIKLASPFKGTNISLSAGGKHIGELRGDGGYAVLAPTVGESGNRYRVINWANDFPPIELNGLIFPVAQEKKIVKYERKYRPIDRESIGGGVRIESLLAPSSLAVIRGGSKDRSSGLVTVARECFGWENWLNFNGIGHYDSALSIIQSVGLGMGLDEARINRIIVSCDPDNCLPACHPSGGDDSCWKKLYKLFPATVPDSIAVKVKVKKHPKGFGAIKRIGERIEGDRVAHAINEAIQGKRPLDISPTGSGKSHNYIKNAPEQWKQKYVNGRVIIAVKDSRNTSINTDNYTLLPPRNEFGFENKDRKTVRADETTPLANILPIGGRCTRTDQFQALANKQIDLYSIGSEPPPCQSCPDKQKCRNTEGWFRKDRRDILASGDDLKCHPDSLLGVDLSEFPTLLIIDEFSDILNAHSIQKENLENVGKEIEDYIQSFLSDGINHYQGIKDDCPDPDGLFKPAREILRELAKLGQSEQGLSRYGLDDQKVFLEALSPYSEAAKELLEKIELLALNLYGDFESRKIENRIDRIELESEILAKLNSRPCPMLPHILRFVAGDSKVNLHIKDNRLAATIFNPDKYKCFETARGLIATDATGDIDRIKALFPGQEIAPFWKGEDNPQKNLSIHIVEVKGIAGRGERSKKFIELHANLIKGIEARHGSKPIQFSLKCDRENFGADGHWGADTRGSNDFKGQRLIVASGMPAPNMTAKRAEFLTMGGNPADFAEWYQREINREILQAIGRPRCHRYPDQHFDFYLIVPPGYDWQFLRWEGASIDFIPANELSRLSGEDRESKIEAAIATLTAQNIAPSVRAIAEVAGIPKTIVARTIENARNAPPDCVLESTTGVSRTVPKPLNKLLKENGTPCDSETLAEKTTQLGAAIGKLLAQKITPSLRTIAGEMGISKDAVARLLKKTKPLDEWIAEIEAPPTAIGNADPPAMVVESEAEPRKNRAIIPGSVVELTFNGDRHRVTAINGQTVVSKPIDGGEVALTHIDWVRLAG